MTKELIKDENEEVLTIDSREVAKMIGKDHSELLKEIEGRKDGKNVGIIPILEKGKFHLSNYFIESTYKSGNRNYKCYLVTKMGCELLGNKQQGKKGILFTIKYVNKFNEMAKELKERNTYKLPQTFSEALRMLADKVDENGKLQEENKIMKPKSEFYDRVTKSESTFSMNDTAKILNYKDIGRNKLFSYLRNKGILMTDNRPYQRFVDSGYFKEIESDFIQNGEIVINHTTCVYQKGIDYIRKILDKDGYKINKRGIKEKKENVIQLENINN